MFLFDLMIGQVTLISICSCLTSWLETPLHMVTVEIFKAHTLWLKVLNTTNILEHTCYWDKVCHQFYVQVTNSFGTVSLLESGEWRFINAINSNNNLHSNMGSKINNYMQHTYTDTQAHTNSYVHVHMRSITHMHKCMYAHICTHACRHAQTHMRVRAHKHTHTHTHTQTHTHSHTHTHTHTHTHVHFVINESRCQC